MADSDKDILITPNVSQTSQPEIKLVGKDNSPMYLKVLDDNTLSFEGTEGQVFSIGPTMSSGDIFSVSDISGIQNMTVNADGSIKIIPTGTNPSSNLYVGDLRHCFVYARGTGNNNAANSLVYVNGKKIVDSSTRGLNLTIINQVDLSVVSSTNYDTYANQTNNDNLATAIGNMTDQQIGILVSEDAWETSNTTNSANLVAAAKLVGLTKLGNIGDANSTNRRPYAAIFMGSGDDANAANKFVIERMSDNDADAPMASISAILVSDGTHASIMGSNNVNAIWGADSNHEEPALIADEDNNIDILGGSGANGQLNVSRTSGATVFLQAQSATGVVGTSTNHALALKTNGTTRMSIANGGAITFNSEYTFPTSDGSANQVLQTDGSGALSFATVSSGSGAVDSIANFSDNRVLTASDADSINGEANFTFDGNNLIVKGSDGDTNSLTDDPIVLIRPALDNSRDATLKIQGARNGSTTANTATLLLSNQDDNLSNANEFNHLGAIVGRVTDTTDNHGDMHFLTFSDGATANDTMTLKGDGNVSISGNISSTSANNYNLYWPLYWQRDNMGTSNIDMRMPCGGAGTSSPNAMAMPRAGKVMAVTFHYYGGTLSTSSAKSDTWRIRKHQNGTADVATKDIVVTMDTLVPTANANQRVKTVELSTPFDFIANDAIGFKRHANASNTIHEVVAVLWIHYDA